MSQALLSMDKDLFVKINQQWTSPFLNSFFSTFTNLHHWKFFQFVMAPVILFFWWFKVRRQIFAVVIAASATIFLADTICYRGIKEYTFRDRPFTNAQLNAEVRVGYRPESSSFPSNHAVNCFALATVLTWYYPTLWMVFFFIAGLVGYSRVYVGVHYPLDVVIGAILGVLIASFLIRLLFDHFVPFKPVYEVDSKRGVLKKSQRLKNFLKIKNRA